MARRTRAKWSGRLWYWHPQQKGCLTPSLENRRTQSYEYYPAHSPSAGLYAILEVDLVATAEELDNGFVWSGRRFGYGPMSKDLVHAHLYLDWLMLHKIDSLDYEG
jgi:hypothetical protein